MLKDYKITIGGLFIKKIQIVSSKTEPENIEKIKKYLVRTQNYNPNIKISKMEKKNPIQKNFGLPMDNRENFSIHKEISKIFS